MFVYLKRLASVGSSGRRHAYDQDLMLSFVWSRAKYVTMAHDAYFCGNYAGRNKVS